MISFILPIYNLYGHRKLAFNNILKEIKKLNVEIIVSEQISNNTENLKDVIHIKTEINDNKIHKSLLINKGVDNSNNTYVWIHDADVYFNFLDALNIIKETKQDVYKPFKRIFILSENESIEFYETQKIKISKGKNKVIKIFGPLSIIIKKECFNLIGKMNENFSGWGYEDFDLASRIIRNYDIYEIDLDGIHLYHPPAIENKNNLILYKKLFNIK